VLVKFCQHQSARLQICFNRSGNSQSSKHLKLVSHRVPKPDVERALCAAGLHRLFGKPAKPFAHADGRDASHYDLGRFYKIDDAC